MGAVLFTKSPQMPAACVFAMFAQLPLTFILTHLFPYSERLLPTFELHS